ncbi:MAG: peptidylprolyl isomerase [Pseudomonadota bacterium]
MKTTLHTGLLLALLSISPSFAADSKDTPATDSKPAATVKDYTVINLDGEEIKYSDVMEVWKGLFQGGAVPDFNSFDENIRQNVLRGLVSERLIHKEAIKSGIDKSEDIKKRLESLQKQLVIQTYIENKSKSLVTDEQIKALYEEKIAAAKGQEELKARHILVAAESDAKKISADLKKGGDFEKVAKNKSTDKGSGVNGGDLGWFAKEKMVPEFFDATFKLKKGEVSAPVKSNFGWHVIKLEDRRPVKVSPFEESKEALKGELSNKAVQSYIENLLKTSSIKYFDENGKEKDFVSSVVAPEPDTKTEEKK